MPFFWMVYPISAFTPDPPFFSVVATRLTPLIQMKKAGEEEKEEEEERM